MKLGHGKNGFIAQSFIKYSLNKNIKNNHFKKKNKISREFKMDVINLKKFKKIGKN